MGAVRGRHRKRSKGVVGESERAKETGRKRKRKRERERKRERAEPKRCRDTGRWKGGWMNG